MFYKLTGLIGAALLLHVMSAGTAAEYPNSQGGSLSRLLVGAGCH